MPACPNMELCYFFNNTIASMPSMATLYKKSYCRENFATCARYRVGNAMGKESVPPNLFPNHDDVADKILAQN